MSLKAWLLKSYRLYYDTIQKADERALHRSITYKLGHYVYRATLALEKFKTKIETKSKTKLNRIFTYALEKSKN